MIYSHLMAVFSLISLAVGWFNWSLPS